MAIRRIARYKFARAKWSPIRNTLIRRKDPCEIPAYQVSLKWRKVVLKLSLKIIAKAFDDSLMHHWRGEHHPSQFFIRLPTRGEWQTAIDNLTRDMAAAGVEVRLNTTATRELLSSLNPDAVVCATGASYEKTGLSPYRPDRDSIPGHTQDNVRDVGAAVRAALADPRSLGGKILILDETAGFLPFGLAEVLANGGAEVEVVTPHMFAAEDVFRTSEMPFLFGRLTKANVRITAQEIIDRIEGDRVEIRGSGMAGCAPSRGLTRL
jgi:hypothetical protein